jgi:zinc resistance-associated protein
LLPEIKTKHFNCLETEGKMKKVLIALVLVVSMGLIASQVLARCWDGHWRGAVKGNWGWHHSNVSPDASYQDFLNETSKLRQELAIKQGEYNALMAEAKPDPEKAAQLSREIVSLSAQIQAKARAHGQFVPGVHTCQCGMHGARYGARGCW